MYKRDKKLIIKVHSDTLERLEIITRYLGSDVESFSRRLLLEELKKIEQSEDFLLWFEEYFGELEDLEDFEDFEEESFKNVKNEISKNRISKNKTLKGK